MPGVATRAGHRCTVCRRGPMVRDGDLVRCSTGCGAMGQAPINQKGGTCPECLRGRALVRGLHDGLLACRRCGGECVEGET